MKNYLIAGIFLLCTISTGCDSTVVSEGGDSELEGIRSSTPICLVGDRERKSFSFPDFSLNYEIHESNLVCTPVSSADVELYIRTSLSSSPIPNYFNVRVYAATYYNYISNNWTIIDTFSLPNNVSITKEYHNRPQYEYFYIDIIQGISPLPSTFGQQVTGTMFYDLDANE